MLLGVRDERLGALAAGLQHLQREAGPLGRPSPAAALVLQRGIAAGWADRVGWCYFALIFLSTISTYFTCY